MNAEDGCTLALVNRGEREKNPIKVVYICVIVERFLYFAAKNHGHWD